MPKASGSRSSGTLAHNMALLYKYLPPEREPYLQDRLLRFTQPGALNDPFECIPIVAEIDVKMFVEGVVERNTPLLELRYAHDKAALKRLRKAIPQVKADFKRRYTENPEYLPNLFLEKYLAHANQRIGIFSLSRRWNSTLMWAHYAQAHAGFCVGYNADSPFFSRESDDCRDVGTVERVDYNSERMSFDISSKVDIDVRLFHRKSADWGYEEEERLVRELQKAKKTVSASPFDIHLFEVPHSAIAELIYGVNARDSLKASIIAFGKSFGIPVYECIISSRTYDMERKQKS